jgi:hypothetical protein
LHCESHSAFFPGAIASEASGAPAGLPDLVRCVLWDRFGKVCVRDARTNGDVNQQMMMMRLMAGRTTAT